MATYSALSDENRASVVSEAKRRATEQGITPEQALYNYAQSEKLSDDAVDSLMGFGAGTTSRWAQSNIPNYQSNTANTVAPTQAANPVSQTVAAPTVVAPTATVSAPSPTATTYQIDPNQTSAGLLSSMLNSDSAYIKDAQNKAMDGMNTRGLLSSSMAQGAGVAAAYDRAAPIATNDASLYANRLTANQQSVNDMANANANRGLTASTFNAGASNDLTKLAFGSQLQQGLAANQAGLTKDVANNQAALEAKARTDTQAFTSAENAATREAALKTSMLNSETTLASANISAQTSRDVAEVNRQYSQAANLSTAATTLWNSFNTGVREITLSDLTTEAKNSAVAQYTSYMKAGLALQGSIAGDIDLTTLAASILPS